jgi:AraC-like DNA-binding protein
MNLYGFLLLLGAVHGFMLSIASFVVARRQTDIRLFSTLIFLISFYLLELFLVVNGIIRKYPDLALVSYPTIYLIGPCLYLLSRLLAGAVWKPKLYAWHLLPFAAVVLFLVPFYASGTESKALFLTNPLSSEFSYLLKFLDGRIFYFITACYSVAAFLVLRKVDPKSVHHHSRVHWLKANVFWFALHMVLVVLIMLFFKANKVLYYSTLSWSKIALSLQLHIIGYGILIKSSLLNMPRNARGGQYIHSKLDAPEAAELKRKVKDALEKEKVYLDPLLSSEKLARKIGVPKHQLSQIFNQEFNASYNDVINRYRVDESIKIMKANTDARINEIAMDAGFIDRSTFYRAFVRLKNMSPSAYKAKLKNS